MTVWVTFNTTFVIYSGWLIDLWILICNSLPVRVRWDLLSTFVLNPCWFFFQRILTLCLKITSRSCPHPSWSSGAVMDEEIVLHVVMVLVILKICGNFVLSLYSSCTCWIKLCITLDSTWCNMYCIGDLLRLLIHGLASIFGSGRFKWYQSHAWL